MPIYEYRCASCGHETEVLQKMSDTPLKTCPACGKDSFVKQISAAGFQLKGSGWYATDFKGSKPASAGKSTEGSEAKSDKESTKAAKDESKPAKDSGSKSESKAEAVASSAGTTPAGS